MQALPALAIVLVPLLTAALVRSRRVSGRGLSWLAVAASLASFGTALALFGSDRAGVSHQLWSWAPDLGLSWTWRLDALTLSLAMLVAGIGAIILGYSGAYFGRTPKAKYVISWLLAFEASMLGLVLADNALLFFLFFELTGICSYFLIQTDVDKSDEAEPAARQALLLTVLAGLPLLVGLVYIQMITGESNMSAWSAADLTSNQTNLALVLVFLGAAAKSAQVPFHFWLPGAMAAPSPISAYLHSATMVKAGIIFLLIVFPVLGAAPLWSPLLLSAGFLTCVWGSYRALAEDDIKKLMAWSTVSQLGLLVLTLGLGTELAVRAAILHLFIHGIFKAALFLTVGTVDKSMGTRSLAQLGGLWRRNPWLTAAAVISAGSMAGIPPLAGFLSKELVLKKTLNADPDVHIPALLGIVIGSVGTVAYSIRFLRGVFFGAAPALSGSGTAPRPREKPTAEKKLSGWFTFGPAFLSVLLILAGLGAGPVDRVFLEPASKALLGYDLEPPTLKLWHGINAPLLWSAAILTMGVLLHRAVFRRLLPVPDSALAPHRGFAALLEGSTRAGQHLDSVLSRQDPRVYIGALLVLGLSSALWIPLLTQPGDFGTLVTGRLSVPTLGAHSVAGPVAVALSILLLRSRDAISQVIMVSLLGFTVVLLFYGMQAPDLVMTQILVEILLTAVLLLGILPWAVRGRDVDWRGRIRLRSAALSTSPRLRVFSHVVAGLAALGAAALVLAVGSADASGLKSAFAWLGPTLGEGKNLVNVILVDFRGLDTMVETLVVLVAGLGAVAALRRSELDVQPPPPRAVRGSGPLLRMAGRFLVPLGVLFSTALLVQGHDDPGGGFVASLCLVLVLLLYVVMKGSDALQGVTQWPARIGLAGAVGILLFTASPLLWGESALRQAGYSVETGLGKFKVHSALFFDIAVVAIVAGGVVAALVALMGRATRGSTSE